MMQFPWIAYWAAGYIIMLWVADHAPASVTYSLLAIILIGALMQQQRQSAGKPKGKAK